MLSYDKSKRIPWKFISIFIFVTIIIILFGIFSYQSQEENAKKEKYNELQNIVNLKYDLITTWRKHRVQEARINFENFFIVNAIRSYFSNSSNNEIKKSIVNWVYLIKKEFKEYQSIFFIDVDKNIKFVDTESDSVIGIFAKNLIDSSLNTNQILLSDLYQKTPNDPIHIDLIIPVLLPKKTYTQSIGAFLIKINPHFTLYNFVQSMQVPTKSAEVLLVRREGNDVIYLNEVRYRKNSALSLKIPISNIQVPAVMAILGKEGIVEGYDYRGIKVLADIKKIPDSPWYLIAKIDADEVFETLNQIAWNVSIMVMILILIIALFLTLLWRHQRAVFYRKLYQGEIEKAALNKHYEYLAKYANDIIILTDHDTKLVEANEKALTVYGYTREEFLKLKMEDLHFNDNLLELKNNLQKVEIENGTIFEVIHKRKDGTTFPAEISARFIEIKNKKFYQGIIRDISERKKSLQLLQESESKYREIIENMGEGFGLVDLEEKFIFANPAAEGIFGVSPEKLQGKSFREFTDSEQFAVIKRQTENRKMGMKNIYEIEIIKPDGDLRNVLITATPKYNEKKEIIAIYAIFRDITEQKQYESALQENEQKFRTFIEQSSEGIVLTDEKGRVVEWNKAMEKISGLKTDEVKNKAIYDVQFQDVSNKFRTSERFDPLKMIILDALRSGSSSLFDKPIEAFMQRKDGELRFIRQTVFPIKTDKGFRIGLLTYDVSEHKHAEELLRESEEKFRQLAENIDQIFYLRTNSKFLYISPSYEKIMGYSPEIIYEDPSYFLNFVHPEDRNKLTASVRNWEGTDIGNFDVEYRIIRPNGSVRWLWTRNFPIYDNEGKLKRIAGISQDITERKQIEQERLRLQNLESLGVLAGGIAHDFNNILGVILGRVSLIIEDASEGTLKNDLLAIEKATRRASRLTNQLLTFAKGGTPEKSIIDVRKIIQDTTKFSLSGSNVIAEFNFKESYKIEADSGQISQVIQNIVLNAKQAMPNGGTIRIDTEDFTGDNAIQYLKISIIDAGIGISKEFINKIFDPYFTTKQTGSGLGLSVCYSIIRRHGGQIFVESEIGLGTTFKVLLPATDKKDLSKHLKISPDIKGLNILIMDDEEEIRDILSALLLKLGHNISTSREGEEAIKLYREAKERGDVYDIVLMDLTIKGGMGGKNAVKILRDIDPCAKVIVSSGYADSSIASFKEDGFDGVLKKPYTLNELNEVINQIINI